MALQQLQPPRRQQVKGCRGVRAVDRDDVHAREHLVEAGPVGRFELGLDVFENEPRVDPRLLRLKNVVLLPHMGSATIEGRLDMGEKVIINIRTFVDGHRPPNRVVPAMV